MPLFCPDNSETLSGCFRNQCPDAAEIRTLTFAKHNEELRRFVLNKDLVINPRFNILAFLVPNTKKAGNIARFHGRVDTYAPGYEFSGGEISWYPFGFVYASEIGSGYYPEKFTDITDWFRVSDIDKRKGIVLSFYCRTTGVDSVQCGLGHKRMGPQIDYFGH